jgi:hypothetical protein
VPRGLLGFRHKRIVNLDVGAHDQHPSTWHLLLLHNLHRCQWLSWRNDTGRTSGHERSDHAGRNSQCQIHGR